MSLEEAKNNVSTSMFCCSPLLSMTSPSCCWQGLHVRPTSPSAAFRVLPRPHLHRSRRCRRGDAPNIPVEARHVGTSNLVAGSLKRIQVRVQDGIHIGRTQRRQLPLEQSWSKNTSTYLSDGSNCHQPCGRIVPRSCANGVKHL